MKPMGKPASSPPCSAIRLVPKKWSRKRRVRSLEAGRPTSHRSPRRSCQSPRAAPGVRPGRRLPPGFPWLTIIPFPSPGRLPRLIHRRGPGPRRCMRPNGVSLSQPTRQARGAQAGSGGRGGWPGARGLVAGQVEDALDLAHHPLGPLPELVEPLQDLADPVRYPVGRLPVRSRAPRGPRRARGPRRPWRLRAAPVAPVVVDLAGPVARPPAGLPGVIFRLAGFFLGLVGFVLGLPGGVLGPVGLLLGPVGPALRLLRRGPGLGGPPLRLLLLLLVGPPRVRLAASAAISAASCAIMAASSACSARSRARSARSCACSASSRAWSARSRALNPASSGPRPRASLIRAAPSEAACRAVRRDGCPRLARARPRAWPRCRVRRSRPCAGGWRSSGPCPQS